MASRQQQVRSPTRALHGATIQPRARRWQLVDVLRGIAILLVLCRHHGSTGYLQDFGWLGVDLFFVLSGFLVSGLVFDEYMRTGAFSGFHFLIRRGFKIYPSFYALITTTTVLMAVSGRGDPIMNYIAEVFYFQNYHEGLWVHTWSLAVEEHFYLLLVFAALIMIGSERRFTFRAFTRICLVLFVAFLGLRIVTSLGSEFTMYGQFFPTHLRMDSLLAGVLLAAWHRYRPDDFIAFFRRRRSLLYACMMLMLLPILLSPFGSFVMVTFGLTGAYIAGAIAVGLAVTAIPMDEEHPVHRWLVVPTAWIGGISYTTYLWHLLVLLIVEMLTSRAHMHGTFVEFVLFAVGSILVGFLTSKVTERPFLRLRERAFPAKGR